MVRRIFCGILIDIRMRCSYPLIMFSFSLQTMNKSAAKSIYRITDVTALEL